MLGYTEATWNQPGMADIEYYSWWYFESTEDDSMDTDTGPLDTLGFTEDIWDCWQHHYSDYSWDELVEYDLASSFEILGWDQTLWEGYYDEYSTMPSTETLDYGDLSDEQKTAALVLCYTKSIWDFETLDSFCVDKPVPFAVGRGTAKERSCDWVGLQLGRCNIEKKGEEFSAHCPNTCGKCKSHDCKESEYKFFLKLNPDTGEKVYKKCRTFVGKNPKKCNNFYTTEVCPTSCSRKGCEPSSS